MAPQSFLPSRLPVKPQRLLPLSNPRTTRTDNRKSFLCRRLKNEKTAFLCSNKKAVLCCFCSFGGWTSTVGRFWKIGPKKPGNPHEYWKKSGWHLFRHPFLERETGIEPACSAWEADILPLNYSRIFIIQWYLFYQIFFLKSSGAFDFFLQKGNSW